MRGGCDASTTGVNLPSSSSKHAVYKRAHFRFSQLVCSPPNPTPGSRLTWTSRRAVPPPCHNFFLQPLVPVHRTGTVYCRFGTRIPSVYSVFFGFVAFYSYHILRLCFVRLVDRAASIRLRAVGEGARSRRMQHPSGNHGVEPPPRVTVGSHRRPSTRQSYLTRELLPRLQIVDPRTRRHLFAEVDFPSAKRLESWKKTFPDPSTSPAHYTKVLVIGGTKVVTAADAKAVVGSRGFLALCAWR